MVITLFGESCVGKSTLAETLKKELGATVYSGKDYLRLAKNESEAAGLFQKLLAQAQEPVVYVISEKAQLALLPPACVRVLVTAPLSMIKERFAKRTGGKLAPPVEKMLESKHGMFDDEAHDVHIVGGMQSAEEACAAVLAFLAKS